MNWPTALETQYRKWLLRRIDAIDRLVSRTLAEAVEEGEHDKPTRLRARIASTQAGYRAAVPISAEALSRVARGIDSSVSAQVAKDVGLLGVPDRPGSLADLPLPGMIDAWVRTNVEFVPRAERELFEALAEAVAEDGTAAAAKWIRRARDRAALIARDQVGNLASAINQQRQRGRGVTHYRWVTRRDRRVRDEHAALHGTVRAWSDPHPTEGHPGEPIGCRCMAVPARSPALDRPSLPPALPPSLPSLPALPPELPSLPTVPMVPASMPGAPLPPQVFGVPGFTFRPT